MSMLRLRSRPDAAGGPGDGAAERTRRRFLRRQRARRWLVWRRLLAAVAVVGVLAGSVWLVLFSSWTQVHQVQVRGTEVLTAAEVDQAAAVPRGVPLATADLDAAEARVEDLAAVRSAEASRSWPDTVRIDVTEREAVAVVSWEGQWRGLDSSGVLFRSFPERPDGLPLLQISSTTSVEALAEAAAVVDALPADILARVETLAVGSIDDITLRLRGGATVTWGSADESADKAAVLAVLLERDATAYDVTAPGRPTLRNAAP